MSRRKLRSITYSRSKGLFAGASLEGAIIVTETGKNEHYYGRAVTADRILSGKATPPSRSTTLRKAASS